MILFIFMTSFFCLIAWQKNVYAYIDPGTGSYLIQILLASIFGSLFFIKLFWSKIKSFFTKLFSRKSA